MTVRSIVCVFFKCYDNYRHVTVFYCHGIIRIKQELLQVIMKKRIVQLQIGAAAIAAILGTGSVINAFPCSAALVTAYAKEQNTEENVTVVNEKTTWKYLDNNTDPASGLSSLTAWTTPDFNDSAWKSAAGKFGAKRGSLTSFNGFTPTVLLQQYQEEESSKCTPTFFFRTTFNAQNIDQITSVTGTLFHDDAVAVYLNGQLITSADMPDEKHENNLYYAGVSAGAPKEASVVLTKDQLKSILKEGSNVLSVELHQDRESSSDIYFEFQNLSLNYNENNTDGDNSGSNDEKVTQKSIFLTVGNDTSSQGITWYADTETAGEVQYAVKTGDTFPENYLTVPASSTAANEKGFYSNQAVLTGLLPDKEYVYRVKNGDTISDIYSFTSGNNDGSYEFAFVGDPQIGAGSTDSDIEGWNETLKTISSKFNADFLLSGGDQVNTASNETQYTGYINELFTSLPSATTIGNHDSGSAAYNQHFNLPNESADKGQTTAGSDYWFVYENTLFINLNSNDRSTAEHKAFIEEAIAANPNVKWKTVVFHHSIFSTASHVDDGDIITRRNELPQVFKDLDIDVVLMGHDHVYTRTYMMDGTTPDTSKGVQSSVTNPTGILYLTANSASGSKYYDIKAPNAEYSAKMDQSYRRTVTDIKVTDTSYTMKTYYADDLSLLDEFTIYKADNTALLNKINELKNMNLSEPDYTKDSWKSFSDALTSAEELLKNSDATQDMLDASLLDLQTAYENLVKTDDQNGNDNNGNNNNGDNNNGNNNNGNNNNGNNNNGNNSGNNNANNNNNSSNKANTSAPSAKTGDITTFAPIALLLAASLSVIAFITKRRRSA